MIKVAITDDHPLVTKGIISMLAPFSQIEIVGVYHTAAATLQGLEEKTPDVLLLDIILPDQSGKELVPVIRQRFPQVQIVALTSLDAPTMVSAMMRRGCMGYLLKDTDTATLIAAIEAVHRNESFIEPSLKEKMVQNMIRFRDNNSRPAPVITQREKQVLQLIAEECSTQEIADRLFISFRTVENHRQRLLQKLDVKNTIGLLKVAIQAGLIK
jgi:DNA-binding NarL/FixJ family response regulator